MYLVCRRYVDGRIWTLVQLRSPFQLFRPSQGLLILYVIAQESIIIILYHYTFQKVNIDNGTRILKQMCFGRKTHFPDTFSNFNPRSIQDFSRRFRISYSRGRGTSILMSFSKICVRPWIRRWTTMDGRRRRRDGRRTGQRTTATTERTTDDDDDRRRTTTDDDGRTQFNISNTTLVPNIEPKLLSSPNTLLKHPQQFQHQFPL